MMKVKDKYASITAREDAGTRLQENISDWHVFDTCPNAVVATDIETYEVAYLNPAAMKKYDYDSRENASEMKCYELIKHFADPCANCKVAKFIEDGSRDEYFYEYRKKKLFKTCSRLVYHRGRKYRLMEVRKPDENDDITQRYKGHNPDLILINECLRCSLEEPDPDTALDILLEHLGYSFGSERAYIFEFNEDRTETRNTYEWCAYGVHPEKQNLQHVPPEATAVWFKKFRAGKTIVMKHLEDIREEDPLAYKILKPQNVDSLMSYALMNKGEIQGYFGFDNPPINTFENFNILLRTIANFIYALIIRRNLYREMKKNTYYDQLTNIGNRYAFGRYFDKLKKKRSLGVVYCDVNGLKMTNDLYGHQAGDRLLIQTGKCLVHVFGVENVFRMGGDEFIAICEGIPDNEELQSRMRRLVAMVEKDGVSLAVGSMWHEKCPRVIDDIIGKADSVLYMEKKKYYEKRDRRHP